MKRIFASLLSGTLILCACSTGTASPPIEVTVVSPVPTTAVPDLIASASQISVEDFESTAAARNPEECGYQWAYDEDLPELAISFERSIQALQPQAQTDVSVFGEKCVHSDGSTDFVIMETDFEVTLRVEDVYDESALGGWIVKVMQAIENISDEQPIGPHPGSVTIVFQSGADKHKVTFSIEKYQKLRPGLSAVEILKRLTGP